MMYIAVSGEDVIAIDTGVARQSGPTELVEACAAIGLKPGDVDTVLLTHGHFDHIGGVADLARHSPNVRVRLNAGDSHMANTIEGQVDALAHHHKQIGASLSAFDDHRQTITEGFGAPLTGFEPLDGGGTVRLGAKQIRAFHTPGHTAGSMCFLIEPDGVLFTGDSIQGFGSRPGGGPLYYEPKRYREMLTDFNLDQVQTVCMGHRFISASGQADSTKTRGEFGAMVKDAMWLWDRIDALAATAVSERPETADAEVARAVAADLKNDVPLTIDPDTQLPRMAAATLLHHIALARSQA